jgi:hypothetical protein
VGTEEAREGGSLRPARFVVALLVALLLTGCVEITTQPAPQDGRPEETVGTASPQVGEGDGQGGGEGYRFLHTRDNGEPVRWSTCEPIEYVVRPDNEPEGGRQMLEEAAARISEVTGLELSFAGTTDEAPSENRQPRDPDRYGDGWSPVLVAYSDPDEYPRLEGRIAGYAGPTYVQAGDRVPRYVSGMVVIDFEQTRSMSQEAARAVMLHELAHVVGLAHVRDRGQLMNPVQYGRSVTDLQDGDLRGLRALGDGECYDPIDPSRFSG